LVYSLDAPITFQADKWLSVDVEAINEAAAEVICRHLGQTGGITSDVRKPTASSTGNLTIGGVNCTGNEANLSQCQLSYHVKQAMYQHPNIAKGVLCGEPATQSGPSHWH